MAYCAKSDIYPKQIATADVVQLTDDSGTKTVMDAALETIVDQAIADADAEINGYCQKVYTVPLSPVPPLVLKYSVDIAIYNLYSRRADFDVPKSRSDRYNRAIAYLKLIVEGKVALGSATPVETSSVNEVSITSNTGEFTRSKLVDF